MNTKFKGYALLIVNTDFRDDEFDLCDDVSEKLSKDINSVAQTLKTLYSYTDDSFIIRDNDSTQDKQLINENITRRDFQKCLNALQDKVNNAQESEETIDTIFIYILSHGRDNDNQIENRQLSIAFKNSAEAENQETDWYDIKNFLKRVQKLLNTNIKISASETQPVVSNLLICLDCCYGGYSEDEIYQIFDAQQLDKRYERLTVITSSGNTKAESYEFTPRFEKEIQRISINIDTDGYLTIFPIYKKIYDEIESASTQQKVQIYPQDNNDIRIGQFRFRAGTLKGLLASVLLFINVFFIYVISASVIRFGSGILTERPLTAVALVLLYVGAVSVSVYGLNVRKTNASIKLLRPMLLLRFIASTFISTRAFIGIVITFFLFLGLSGIEASHAHSCQSTYPLASNQINIGYWIDDALIGGTKNTDTLTQLPDWGLEGAYSALFELRQVQLAGHYVANQRDFITCLHPFEYEVVINAFTEDDSVGVSTQLTEILPDSSRSNKRLDTIFSPSNICGLPILAALQVADEIKPTSELDIDFRADVFLEGDTLNCRAYMANWASHFTWRHAEELRKDGKWAEAQAAYAKARDLANEAIKHEPYYALAYKNLGNAYHGLQDYTQAQNNFQLAIDYSNDKNDIGDFWLSRGDSCLYQQNYSCAQEAYIKAEEYYSSEITDDTKQLETMLFRTTLRQSIVLSKQNSCDEAEAMVSNAANAGPGNDANRETFDITRANIYIWFCQENWQQIVDTMTYREDLIQYLDNTFSHLKREFYYYWAISLYQSDNVDDAEEVVTTFCRLPKTGYFLEKQHEQEIATIFDIAC